MIHQAAPIIAEALLHSLAAGAVSFTLLRILLAALKTSQAFIRYHLCNISLIIPLVFFIISLTKLTNIEDAAPAYPVAPPVATNNVQSDLTVTAYLATAPEAEPLTLASLWAAANEAMLEYSMLITWIYIAGLLLFSLRLLMQYLQSRRLKTIGTLPVTNEWYRLLDEMKARLNISRHIHIACTERKISPCIIGHAKAVILIPISLANHLTTEQAEAILLHELAHYKQYDHYINLCIQCIKCILFLNPFVWLLAALADKYRELSCDETASRHERNIELAETLTLIAGMQARHNSLVMSLRKKSPLLARVQALLAIRHYDKSSHRFLPLVVTSIALATTLLIAGSTKLFSSEKDSLRDQLKEISAQMFKEGNHKYIFVDAVLDSLVVLPSKADMVYMGTQYFSILAEKGKVKMDAPTRERYIKKLQLFLLSVDEDAQTPVTYDAIANHGVLTMEHIMNKQSSFRNYTMEERYRAGIAKQGWKKVIAALVKDDIVQPNTKNFSMEYGPAGIKVNGWKLEGVQYTKYRQLLKDAVGIDLTTVSGSLSQDDLQQYLGLNSKSNLDEVNTLAAISRLLFSDGKLEYVLADAMKDGYLEDGKKFTLVMNGEELEFAGVRMSREHAAQYNEKYRLFREYYGCPDCHGGVHGTLYYSDLIDQNSDLRQGGFLLAENYDRRYKMTIQLLAEMHEDGLIDTNYKVEIFYVGQFFTVNGTMLTDAESAEYIRLIRQYGLSSKNTRNEDAWSLLKNPDKPFPPGTLGDQAEMGKIRKAVLQEISDELFNKGLTYYIMVDAVKDGYLKDGESFHISYQDNIVTIKGKTLSLQDQAVYNKKMEEFTRLFESDDWYGNTRSTVSLAEILDPSSSLRTKERRVYTKDDTPFSLMMLTEMANDGLIDMAYQVRIECTDSSITVNHKKLTGDMYHKYRTLYKRAHPNNGEKCSNTVQFNVDRPFPPDNKTGKAAAEKQGLNELIEDLFARGYQGFLIAELVRDGYIKKGEQYTVHYKNGALSLEGKQIPEEARKHYERRMAQFIAANPYTEKVSWSVTDVYNGTNSQEDFNVQIVGGAPTEEEREQKRKEKESHEELDKMIASMQQDGLLNKMSYYLIEYKKDGVYVNAMRPKGSLAKKYDDWIASMGYERGMGKFMESIPDGVKIPDRKIGNSVITMPVHGNNLPAIAQLMFVDGNPNFILAHALHDGILRERENYTFQFSGGKTYFNGKLLPAPHQAKYTRLMRDFMTVHNVSSDKYIMRGAGITKKQLNTPESGIRRERINKGQNEKGEYYVDRVIRMMAADGLIDTTQKHNMEYNARGIFVNGKKLTADKAAKYETILKEGYGRSPRWIAGDGISYSNEP